MWTSSLFHYHDKAVAVFEKRAQVLAQNLAHAETPGFKARDLDFRSLLQAARSGSASEPLWADQPSYRLTHTESLNGNTVDQTTEVSEFSQNNMLHRASLHCLHQRIQSIKLALKGE